MQETQTHALMRARFRRSQSARLTSPSLECPSAATKARGTRRDVDGHTLCVCVVVCEGWVVETAEIPVATRKRLALEASSDEECRHTHTPLTSPRSNPKYKHGFHGNTYVQTGGPSINTNMMNCDSLRKKQTKVDCHCLEILQVRFQLQHHTGEFILST